MPICTDKVDSLWCHRKAKSPYFLKQQPTQLFAKDYFFKGPDNLFLFMEAVLEAGASDAFVARNCKME